MRTSASRWLAAITCATLFFAAACSDRELTAPDDPSSIDPQLAAALISGTSTNGPELPRLTVDTRLIAPTGRTITVNAGGNLQLALDQALPGDVVLLQAGATFTGNFTLPNKSGTGWITIRTSAPDASLPPQGTRITPSYSSVLPKIVTPNVMPALATAYGAHHYRLIGLEIAPASSLTMNYGLLRLGDGYATTMSQVANNLIVDRVYVHGTSIIHLQRCIELNSASTAIIDSYLSECHGKNQDTQAIIAWAGPGPYRIENNHLEGAGENVMFGGADPRISGVIPSDITIRRNYFYKPAAWKGVWTVKNHLEIKNAQRVLIEGNVFENTWQDGQDFSQVWKPVNQSGTCTWCAAQDITFRYNRIRNAPNGFNLIDKPQGTVAGPLRRVQITHNVIDNINAGPIYYGSGRIVQILGGVTDLAIDHNTMFSNNGSALILFGNLPSAVRFVFRNNVANRGQYGVFGSGVGDGTKALNTFAAGWIFASNIVIGASPTTYPANNFYPSTTTATGFVDFANANYRLTSTSPYLNKATDGTNPGADIAAVENATRGVTTGAPSGTVPTTTTPTSTPSYTYSVPGTTVPVNGNWVASASVPTGTARVRWSIGTLGVLRLENVTSTYGEQIRVWGVIAGTDWLKVAWESSTGATLKRDSVQITAVAPVLASTNPYTWSIPSKTILAGGKMTGTASTPPGVTRVRWRIEKWGPLGIAGVGATLGERIEVQGVSKGSDYLKVWWENSSGATLYRDSTVVTVQ